jgi:hypothetical protein
MADLVSTLNLLDNHDPKGSSQRLLNSEFLSFLHSVQKRRQRQERIQLLAGSVDPAAPIPLTRWLRRHPEFSASVRVGSGPLREFVGEWLASATSQRSNDTPPTDLVGLRTAVERWVRETGDQSRAFAWTRK